MRALAAIAFVVSMSPLPAFGHSGAPEQTMSWTFDPWIVAPLTALCVLYLVGSFALRRRTAQPPGLKEALYWGGWLSLAASLISPLHWLGERLFTFHMIEHEIIMAISAPLLVLANPVGPLLWGLPHRLRVAAGRAMRQEAISRSWRWLTRGTQATLLHGIAIWAWHAPVLFDDAVTDAALHRLQHLSFFLSAILFWWSVFRRSEAGVAAWHVFVTMLHTSVLGALMALSPRVLYGAQTASSASWGLTPLEDQQLAGIIMWVPAGTIYAGAAIALAAIWIRQTGARTRQGDVAGAI